MKRRYYWIISLCLLVFSAVESMAQNTTIKASIDSTQLWIGEQAKIHIEIAADQNADIDLMFLDKNIMQGIEIVEKSEPDTADIGNNRMLINYNYTITSFDEELYSIPPFKVGTRGDTILSNELALKVINIPVDTTQLDKFFDIKAVKNPPMVWKDYINYILYPLIVLLPLGLIILVYFLFTKKKPIAAIRREEPLLPPHIVALRELDSIKAKKIWQSGKEKEYHSCVTDTLRYYMERRFNIQAMEMTSGEILEKVKGVSDVDNVFDKLKQILLLADLVKFAKYKALPDENELSLLNAYLFVNNTKIEEIKASLTEEKEEDSINETQTPSDKSKGTNNK